METELLAQAVEQLSVLASDHRTRKPVEVPRPGWVQDDDQKARNQAAVAAGKDVPQTLAASDNPFTQAMARMAATRHSRGGVRGGAGGN